MTTVCENTWTEHRFVMKCRTVTPLSIGNGMPSALTDRPLRRTASGQIVVPGTSIAGVLRTAMESLRHSDEAECLLYRPDWKDIQKQKQLCGCHTCRLFGEVIAADHPQATASRVIVRDSIVISPSVRIVDAVTMDRKRRVAADARKFDGEELQPGAILWLDIQADRLTDQERARLQTALLRLGTGQVSLGSGGSFGYGHLEALFLNVYQRDLRQKEHLLASVLNDSLVLPEGGGDSLAAWPGDTEQVPISHATDGSRLHWQFVLTADARFGGTYRVADPVSASMSGWDKAPRGLSAGGFTAELPARSVRGVVRSTAERILKSIGDSMRADLLTESLFGSTGQASRIHVDVQPIAERPAILVPFDHVAIDRFTGGAVHRRKFDEVAARHGAFQLRLTFPAAAEDWMKGLIALTLREIDQGRAAIGGGSSIGHGRFRLHATLTDSEWLPVLNPSTKTIDEWIGALHRALHPEKCDPPGTEGPESADVGKQPEEPDVIPPETTGGHPGIRNIPSTSNAKSSGEAPSDGSTTETAVQTPPAAGWTLYTGRLTNKELTDRLQKFGDSGNPDHSDTADNSDNDLSAWYAFVESPVSCVLRTFQKSLPELIERLKDAWQFRVFSPFAEIYARRHRSPCSDDWMIRLLHDTALSLSELDAFRQGLQAHGTATGSAGSRNYTALMPGPNLSAENSGRHQYAQAVLGLTYPIVPGPGQHVCLQTIRLQFKSSELMVWENLVIRRETDA
ncbi:MAG: hypothetical protein KDA96_00615 [Planctomycetaceae bacterium]|nr:hypothetical protein [Planctomycetaceae bacterium]